MLAVTPLRGPSRVIPSSLSLRVPDSLRPATPLNITGYFFQLLMLLVGIPLFYGTTLYFILTFAGFFLYCWVDLIPEES